MQAFRACAMKKNMQSGTYLQPNRLNSCIVQEIGVGKHDGDTNRAERENLHILKIQDGGRPPYWKLKSCNNFAIATKFCVSTQFLTANRAECEHFHILKIQDET